jgi:hypothetical protein
MPEYESVVAASMHAIADALDSVSASICYLAANQYEGKTPGEKREMAAVMFHTGRQRFGGIKHDGRRIADADVVELDELWSKMTGKKLKR